METTLRFEFWSAMGIFNCFYLEYYRYDDTNGRGFCDLNIQVQVRTNKSYRIS